MLNNPLSNTVAERLHLDNLQRLTVQHPCMAMQQCAETGCENKVSSAFSCSVCDEFKCMDCMTESSMSICLSCDAVEVEHNLPSFGEWDGGSFRSWFYAGFISTYLERCRQGKSFTVYVPFATTESGFVLTLPKVTWGELDEHIEEAHSSVEAAHALLANRFSQFEFPTPSTVEAAFEALRLSILADDPWWEGLTIETHRFEDGNGPLPWPDHGRVVITMKMDEHTQ